MFIQSIAVSLEMEKRLAELQRESARRYAGYNRIYRIKGTAREYAVGTEHDDELKPHWIADPQAA
ncbi:hypothetical protein [Rhizobium lentis]|uniref:Uncharacterized protein n=1 Tax=Rhizobium lentis TaxID=1138194 RepID=A0ABS7IFN5_9HYPH|nr:hypothetical protein [Rhizobium lentis]MBX5089361.1 hypothetical protein [Rhizobium lentis]